MATMVSVSSPCFRPNWYRHSFGMFAMLCGIDQDDTVGERSSLLMVMAGCICSGQLKDYGIFSYHLCWNDASSMLLNRQFHYIKVLLLLLSTHSHDYCLWRESDNPAFGPPPAYLSIWPAAPSLQRGLSTNPGVKVWCVCGCS